MLLPKNKLDIKNNIKFPSPNLRDFERIAWQEAEVQILLDSKHYNLPIQFESFECFEIKIRCITIGTCKHA